MVLKASLTGPCQFANFAVLEPKTLSLIFSVNGGLRTTLNPQVIQKSSFKHFFKNPLFYKRTMVIKYQLNLEKYEWSRAALNLGRGSTH